MSSTQIDYQELKKTVASTSDLPSATQQLRASGQYPKGLVDQIENQYDRLDPETQRQIDTWSPEATTSFFHLMSSLDQMSKDNKQNYQKVSSFLTQCINSAGQTSS